MKRITGRDKQTIRFLKWIRQYHGWWYLICTPEEKHMNADMMRKLIEHLEKEQLYEIIFVLLMVHREEKFMKPVNTHLLLDIITDNWEGKVKTKEEMIKEITCLLK